MTRILRRGAEGLLPSALGTDFRYLWGATVVGNLADGVLLAAGPLLIASITREPFPVAMAVLAQRLPWVLFGVVAGAVIDRLDRRLLMVVVNLLRALVFAGLAVVVATGNASLPVVYAVM